METPLIFIAPAPAPPSLMAVEKLAWLSVLLVLMLPRLEALSMESVPLLDNRATVRKLEESVALPMTNPEPGVPVLVRLILSVLES